MEGTSSNPRGAPEPGLQASPVVNLLGDMKLSTRVRDAGPWCPGCPSHATRSRTIFSPARRDRESACYCYSNASQFDNEYKKALVVHFLGVCSHSCNQHQLSPSHTCPTCLRTMMRRSPTALLRSLLRYDHSPTQDSHLLHGLGS